MPLAAEAAARLPVDAVRRLAGQRIVLDCRSSLQRHGVTRAELPDVVAALGGQRLEGCSLHLPLDRTDRSDPVGEAVSWVRARAVCRCR